MKKVLATLAVVATLVAVTFAQDPAPAPAAAASVAGTWDITTTSPIGENTNTMVISKDGEALKAVVKGDAGELPYDKIEQKGADVKIVLTIDYQGSPMTMTYTGTVDGKKMGGDVDFGGLAQGTWSAAQK